MVRANPRKAAAGFVDPADEQQVAHPGGDRRREVDGPETLQHPTGATEFVEQLQVLQQRRLGVDSQPDDLAALRAARDADLGRRQRRDVEGLADALAALDLGEQDPQALVGQRDGQGRGDRRLAGAALAGDHVQPHTGKTVGAQRVGGGRHTAKCMPSRRCPAAVLPAGRLWAVRAVRVTGMTSWEYATVPLIVHATKAILDNWGRDGWELVQVVPGPDGNGLVAYLKRPLAGGQA